MQGHKKACVTPESGTNPWHARFIRIRGIRDVCKPSGPAAPTGRLGTYHADRIDPEPGRSPTTRPWPDEPTGLQRKPLRPCGRTRPSRGPRRRADRRHVPGTGTVHGRAGPAMAPATPDHRPPGGSRHERHCGPDTGTSAPRISKTTQNQNSRKSTRRGETGIPGIRNFPDRIHETERRHCKPWFFDSTAIKNPTPGRS